MSRIQVAVEIVGLLAIIAGVAIVGVIAFGFDERIGWLWTATVFIAGGWLSTTASGA